MSPTPSSAVVPMVPQWSATPLFGASTTVDEFQYLRIRLLVLQFFLL